MRRKTSCFPNGGGELVVESGSGGCGNKATPRQEKREADSPVHGPLEAAAGCDRVEDRVARPSWAQSWRGREAAGRPLGPTPESGPPPCSSAPARAPALRGPHGPPDHLL